MRLCCCTNQRNPLLELETISTAVTNEKRRIQNTHSYLYLYTFFHY